MILNVTHLEHAIIAAAITGVGVVFGHAVLAGVFAVGLFYGREVAQHEYKEAAARRVSITGLPIGIGAITHWTADSIIDVVAPILSVGLIIGYADGWFT